MLFNCRTVCVGDGLRGVDGLRGPIAQLVEQLAFNQWVAGSSPARLTTFPEETRKKRAVTSCLLLVFPLIFPLMDLGEALFFL